MASVRVGSLVLYLGLYDGTSPRRGIVYEMGDRWIEIFWDTKGFRPIPPQTLENLVRSGDYVVEVF